MGAEGTRFAASVALALLTLALLVFARSNGHLFLNGGLSLKHQALAADCRACHSPWSDVRDEKCVKCHDRPRSHLASSAPADKLKVMEKMTCVKCHIEHEGPDIRASFPGSVVCNSCHDHSTHPEIKKRPIMNKPEPNRVFPHSIHDEAAPPGMNMEKCGDCHIDADGKGTLGYDVPRLNEKSCRPCHYGNAELSENAAPNRYINKASFKHAKHGKFDCLQCHKDILKIPELSDENLPSVKQCFACHGKQAGTTCVKCHDFHIVAGAKKVRPQNGRVISGAPPAP